MDVEGEDGKAEQGDQDAGDAEDDVGVPPADQLHHPLLTGGWLGGRVLYLGQIINNANRNIENFERYFSN